MLLMRRYKLTKQKLSSEQYRYMKIHKIYYFYRTIKGYGRRIIYFIYKWKSGTLRRRKIPKSAIKAITLAFHEIIESLTLWK